MLYAFLQVRIPYETSKAAHGAGNDSSGAHQPCRYRGSRLRSGHEESLRLYQPHKLPIGT